MAKADSGTSEWSTPLASRLAEGATVAQVAQAVVDMWLEIDSALHPIIGHQGVAALFNRSLHLTTAVFPWLAQGISGLHPAVDPLVLKAALANQTAAAAVAGGSALLQSFHALLASLVGSSLTDQLLRSIWAHSSGGTPARETSS